MYRFQAHNPHHIICTLYCVFTTPSQVFICHHVSPLHLPLHPTSSSTSYHFPLPTVITTLLSMENIHSSLKKKKKERKKKNVLIGTSQVKGLRIVKLTFKMTMNTKHSKTKLSLIFSQHSFKKSINLKKRIFRKNIFKGIT